jgi:hypothetical protein
MRHLSFLVLRSVGFSFAVFLLAVSLAAQQTPDTTAPPASTSTSPAPVSTPSTSAAQTTKTKLTKTIDVLGSQQWTDTGIDLVAGEQVVLSTQGQVKYQAQFAGPEGLQRGWGDLMRVLPVNGAGRGALVGKIGSEEGAIPFPIGAQKQITAQRSGRLFLGVNQAANETSEGTFQVNVQVLAAAAASNANVAKIAVTPTALQQIPRRIGDKEGNPGDMVNFIIIGSEVALKRTFEAGGWMLADRTKKQAVLNALVSSLNKNAYLAMPMSELYLFGRVQDFGFEHAEPVQMVAQRHHLRVWKAPLQLQGQDVWVGAATHDIGFERDQRNNGVTHKIDPEIDKEREYMGETLDGTGNVAVLDHVLPPDPLTEAHTATGGSFKSDGRILVLQLR